MNNTFPHPDSIRLYAHDSEGFRQIAHGVIPDWSIERHAESTSASRVVAVSSLTDRVVGIWARNEFGEAVKNKSVPQLYVVMAHDADAGMLRLCLFTRHPNTIAY